MSIEPLNVEKEEKKKEGEKKTVLSIPRHNPPPEWGGEQQFNIVGKPHPRLEGIEKVTGRAQYSTDLRPARLLFGGVLRSPHPHAKIVAVDASKAEALPGVHAVLSRNDELNITWYQEELPLFDEKVRFIGDEVAAVAAESEEIVEDALRLIEVDYEVLPFVTDMTKALKDDAPQIHKDGNKIEEEESERGDFEAGWETAVYKITRTYTTQTALHNALEPHTTTAHWQGDELLIYESTQGIFQVREMIAEAVGLPQNQVRVIKQHMGGGFGAKQTAWKQTIFAALLSKKTGRPVQIALDREGENLATGNRNPTRQMVQLGANEDGTLTAIGVEVLVTAGAYQTPGEGSNVVGLFKHLYKCENVKTKSTRVYTNAGPAVAFRAPGYAEAAFALESAMDELAYKLDIDPLELRRINYTERDQEKDLPWSSPQGLEACYKRLDESFGWQKRSKQGKNSGSKRRGFGLAAHEWQAGSGSPPAYAWVKINTDGSVDVVTGTQDIGTGSRTMLAQLAAETLGIAVKEVRVQLGDTAMGPYAPTSSGSFTTPSMAPAVRAAAIDARDQLLEAASMLLETEPKNLQIEDGKIFEKGDEANGIEFVKVAGRLAPHMIQGHGAYHAKPEGTSIRTFSAQCAEVEVDTQTGEVTVLRIVSAPDCGRILNPQLAESQVIGGVTQGLGFGLTEERIIDHTYGVVLNADLEEYKVPTVADIPEIVHAEVNLPDLNANTTGTKGLGELPLIPTAPAIANAVYDAIGVRFTELPLSRQRIVQALQEREE